MSWEDILKDSSRFIDMSGQINVSKLMKNMTEISDLTSNNGDIRKLFADIEDGKITFDEAVKELKILTKEFNNLSASVIESLMQVINYREMESWVGKIF